MESSGFRQNAAVVWLNLQQMEEEVQVAYVQAQLGSHLTQCAPHSRECRDLHNVTTSSSSITLRPLSAPLSAPLSVLLSGLVVPWLLGPFTSADPDPAALVLALASPPAISIFLVFLRYGSTKPTLSRSLFSPVSIAVLALLLLDRPLSDTGYSIVISSRQIGGASGAQARRQSVGDGDEPDAGAVDGVVGAGDGVVRVLGFAFAGCWQILGATCSPVTNRCPSVTNPSTRFASAARPTLRARPIPTDAAITDAARPTLRTRPAITDAAIVQTLGIPG
ncbi:uncharacterized protein BDZ99DRAFT_482551 [Mytilinidion resinicola]|uniref:Uncharacterized protein n=1 Tax=Mytilinidion resinicola TaxID=574789 RepID=A0A6A6Y2I0_9PEZI|nr:uncharacterized protein BDZ99DRAFT_482551 [Mytilinidion resinicola]KAF2803026.1 hypothetical protein BDZ99DRAFT_482551 [Mytilinidion resinicola]